MDQQHEPQPGVAHQTVVVQQQESNSLGLAGFIVSLAGWITCGALCPVGLILSLCALGKRPRGFAIAGVVLGLPGVLFFLLFGFGLIFAVLGIGAAATLAAVVAGQQLKLAQAQAVLRAEYAETSTLPDETGAQALFVAELGWEPDEVRYIRNSDTSFTLIEPGQDGAFDTSDDLTQTWDVGGTLIEEQVPDSLEFGS
ncbi:MAG: DUF4190 domain-containing protein [Planctomycetota bacterium]